MKNRNAQARSIFYEGLELDPELLPAFLDSACGGNSELRSLVEALFQADQVVSSFLDQPAIEQIKAQDTSILSPVGPSHSQQPNEGSDSGNAVKDQVGRAGETPEVPGYEILEELGRGGMAIVYRARQIHANRFVALKMILDGGRARNEDLKRFRTEAEALASLQHPGIVQIFEVGEHKGKPFFSLELCSAGNLNRYLNGTPLPPRQSAKLVLSLAKAVHAAHEANVLHRDLKPGNVLLTPHSSAKANLASQSNPENSRPSLDSLIPKVTDFGLAKKLDDEGHTHTGMILGTASYMSPEQAKATKDVGVASDVYSLGTIFYECLTGRPPFRAASSAETILQVLYQEPVAPRHLQPKVPRDLETILLKSINKEPKRRYATADALAEDLHRFLEGEPIQARRTSALERWLKWARRQPATAGLYMLVPVLLIVALLGGGAIWLWQQAESARTREQGLRNLAEQRENQAEAERKKANRERTIANQERKKARAAQKRAEVAKENADSEKAKALKAKAIAENQKVETLKANAVAKRRLYFNRVMRAQFEWEQNRIEEAKSLLEAAKLDSEELLDWEWHHVNQLCNTELSTFRGPKAAKGTVTFSPDGQWLFSTSGGRRQNQRLTLWNLKTKQKQQIVEKSRGYSGNVCFSPDGKHFAWGQNGEVKIFNTKTGKVVFTLPGQMRVSFSPDGKRIVTANGRATATVWDATTRKVLCTLEHRFPFDDLAFSPDGNWIASANRREAIIWDSVKGELRLPLKGHQDRVRAVRFSPDGRRLATASVDGTVKIWDAQIAPGARLVRRELQTMRGHFAQVNSVCFSPGGSKIVSGSADRTVRLWDAKNGSELWAYRGHRNSVMSVAFSADGKRIASLSPEGTLKIWDATRAQTCRELPVHSDLMNTLCFSPDGKRLASGGGSKLTIWDLEHFKPVVPPVHQEGRIWSVVFSSCGKYLACGSKGVFIRDAKTAKKLFSEERNRTVNTICFSPSSKLFAIGCADGTVKVWNTKTRQLLHTFQAQKGGDPKRVSFSPDGEQIASAGGMERTVRIWNAGTGLPSNPITSRIGAVELQYSPNGTRIAIGGVGGNSIGGLGVFDARTGRQFFSSKAHRALVTAVCFSPDGRRLASCARDRIIRIWDVESGEQTAVLTGHRQPITDLCFSPDGKCLASCSSRPGVIKIWYAPGYVPKR